MRYRFFVSLLAVLLVSGCATDPAPISPVQAKSIRKAAYMEMLECAFHKLDWADDGISDAKTVALTVAGLCVSEYNDFIDAWARTDWRQYNQYVQDQLYKKFNSQRMKINSFLPIVMRHRANDIRRMPPD